MREGFNNNHVLTTAEGPQPDSVAERASDLKSPVWKHFVEELKDQQVAKLWNLEMKWCVSCVKLQLA